MSRNWFKFLLKKRLNCYVAQDYLSNILDQNNNLLFFGNLIDALLWAKQKSVKLNLIFDYDCVYVALKYIPQAMEEKNRANWELYQEKELFLDQELNHKIQYTDSTVWLSFGDLSYVAGNMKLLTLINKYRKYINRIEFLGYNAFITGNKLLSTALKIAQVHNKSQEIIRYNQAIFKLFIFFIENNIHQDSKQQCLEKLSIGKFIIIGTIYDVFGLCRVIECNQQIKFTLKNEIEETGLYLARNLDLHHQDKIAKDKNNPVKIVDKITQILDQCCVFVIINHPCLDPVIKDLPEYENIDFENGNKVEIINLYQILYDSIALLPQWFQSQTIYKFDNDGKISFEEIVFEEIELCSNIIHKQTWKWIALYLCYCFGVLLGVYKINQFYDADALYKHKSLLLKKQALLQEESLRYPSSDHISHLLSYQQKKDTNVKINQSLIKLVLENQAIIHSLKCDYNKIIIYFSLVPAQDYKAFLSLNNALLKLVKKYYPNGKITFSQESNEKNSKDINNIESYLMIYKCEIVL